MSDPWLSVLMPVYNGAATLRETLESLVDQAEGVELILVDQGSSDGSVEVANEFVDRMDLRIVSAPDNENWVQNTNLALSMARAPRASLLHQDDLWRPGRAELLRLMFEASPEAALWVHGSEFIDELGKRVGALAPWFGARPRDVSAAEAMGRLIVQNTIAIPSAAFPVAAAKALGGLDEKLWYTADWHLWLGLAKRGDAAWSPENATAFRLHGSSLTVLGSKDLEDFEAQLAIPIERHAEAVPASMRGKAIEQADASNLVNVYLASVFHGRRRPIGPVVRALIALGPSGWGPFLKNTRIMARMLPRLRLMRQRKRAGA